MNGNDFVKYFLRTPLRIFMGNTMLITVTGRRTGRKFSTPVNYYCQDGYIWVMTSRNRTWWRNVKHGAAISLLMDGRDSNAFAELELDEKAVESHLLAYLTHMPMPAKSLGIRMENRIPDPGDIKRVAKERLFVKIKLDSPADRA